MRACRSTEQNKLQKAPPFPVEQALKRLGENLRTARVRRNLTIRKRRDRIGTGSRAVTDAEKGKPSMGIVVYSALFWLYDLLQPMELLADPAKDTEGLSLEAAKSRHRIRRGAGLDNDF